VRDSEGSEGWVLHSLLSAGAPLWCAVEEDENFKIFAKASESSDLAATLQSGSSAYQVCDSGWCLIDGDGFKGYIKQSNLWGVYPGEKVE